MRARARQAVPKIVFTIEYTASPNDVNLEDGLDQFRQTGEATVVAVRLEPRSAK